MPAVETHQATPDEVVVHHVVVQEGGVGSVVGGEPPGVQKAEVEEPAVGCDIRLHDAADQKAPGFLVFPQQRARSQIHLQGTKSRERCLADKEQPQYVPSQAPIAYGTPLLVRRKGVQTYTRLEPSLGQARTRKRNCPAKFMAHSAAWSVSASRRPEGVLDAGSGGLGWLLAELPPDAVGDGSVRRIDDGGRNGSSEVSFTSLKRNLK